MAAVIASLVVFGAGIVDVITWLPDPHHGWSDALQSILVLSGAATLWTLIFALPPLVRAEKRVTRAIQRRALGGDGQVAPLAADQPVPLLDAELSSGPVELGFSLGPLANRADMAIIGGWLLALIGVSAAATGIYGLVASAGRATTVVMGLVLLAGAGITTGGLWLVAWGRRNGRGQHLVADEYGLRLLLAGTERELARYPWADARAFTVRTVQLREYSWGHVTRRTIREHTWRDITVRTIRMYRLDTGTACLEWNTNFDDDDATLQAQHVLTNRLIVTRAGLPLRDLTGAHDTLHALASEWMRPLNSERHNVEEAPVGIVAAPEPAGVAGVDTADGELWAPVRTMRPTMRWFVWLWAADAAGIAVLALVVLAVHVLVR